MEEEVKGAGPGPADGTGRSGKKGGAGRLILNVLGVLLCVIFIPIIIMNVVMIVQSYTAPDEMPSVFGVSPVIVLSGSMSPEFEAGDMIFVRKVDPETLREGDVVCFLEDSSAITHRIIEVQHDEETGILYFVTRGDANNIDDALPVVAEQIQGKYNGFHITGLGDFAIFLQSTPGMLLFIGGPILLFVLWDVLRRLIVGRKEKAERRELEEESASRQQELEAMEQELARLRAQTAQSQAQTGGGASQEQDAPGE